MSGAPRAVRLVERRALSASVIEVAFETVDESPVLFEAGQYVALHVPLGQETVTSYYSIASPPDGSGQFSLCVKTGVTAGTMGAALTAAPLGTEAEFSGPGGDFRVKDPGGTLVFAAAGTGVSPLRAMLLSVANEARAARLVLGARNEAELLYGKDWTRLEQEQSRFSFWPVLSQPENGWAGRTGYVQDHLAASVKERSEPADVYLCGSAAMVEECEQRLQAAGVDPARIHFEKYG